MHPTLELTRKVLALRPRPRQLVNLGRYAACYAAGWFPSRLPYRPITFGVYVTSRCNLKCPFCYNRGVNKDRAGRLDMTVEGMTALLAHPTLRDAIRVAFTGGEPLLHPDLFAFVALARKHRKLTYVATNGLLLSERLEELRTSPLSTAHVSLYENHLDRQVEGVQRLRAANPRILVFFATIVTTRPESWQAMRRTVEVAAACGVRDLLFSAYSPVSANDIDLCYTEENSAMRAHLSEFAAEFGRDYRLTLPIPLPRDPARRFCVVPYTAPYVGMHGAFTPCCEILPPTTENGSLFDGEFWNGKHLVQFRKNFVSKFPVHPRCEHCPGSAQGRAKGFRP